MSTVKVIFYDPETIKTSDMLSVVRAYWTDNFYTIPGLIFVRTEDSPKTIYTNFGSLIKDKNIFISCVDTTDGSYWGFMKKDLWIWLKKQDD